MTTSQPPPTVPDLGGPLLHQRDAVALLVDDHRLIERLVTVLVHPRRSPKRRADVADVLIAQLIRHTSVEQRHLYPVVRRVLADGDAADDERRRADAAVVRTVHRLDRLDPGAADFAQLCAELRQQVARHVREQEGGLFPRLRQACDPRWLWELGRRVLAARETAPTRPHPHAPGTAPWCAAARPLLGAADRIRDEISRRPTEPVDLLRRARSGG